MLPSFVLKFNLATTGPSTTTNWRVASAATRCGCLDFTLMFLTDI
jgi:hypothetical protein